MEYLSMLVSIGTPVVTGLVVGVMMSRFNRKEDKRHAEIERRAELRRKEGKLSLDMIMATAKLSYATAIAMKRGKANGEVEEGVESYKDVRKQYLDFINEEHVNHMNEIQ